MGYKEDDSEQDWLTGCRFTSLEMVREKMLYDSHPLEYMRINATLAQFEAFVDFYGIKDGDGMYIAPEDRLEIW